MGMRRYSPIFLSLLLVAVSCVENDPSWLISWETGESGKETPVTPPDTKPDTPDTTYVLPTDVPLLEAFLQDFGSSDTAPFSLRLHNDGDDYRYFPNFPSLSEIDTDILMLRLDPGALPSDSLAVEASAHTFYGSYSFRIKMPDLSRVKKTTDTEMEISLQGDDPGVGVSGIGMKFTLSQPSKVTVTSLNGSRESQYNRSVAVMLSAGQDISTKFQTIGWDWAPDCIRWWILDASTNKKTVINEIEGKDDVPWLPAILSLKIYHSADAPEYPFEMEVDNISYQPFIDYIQEWRKKYFEN